MANKLDTAQESCVNEQVPKAHTTPLAAVTVDKSLVSVPSKKAICSINIQQTQRLTITKAVADKLKAHKHNCFTGITHVVEGEKIAWKLYFYLGKLVWTLSKTDQQRSWYRQIRSKCPDLIQTLQPDPDAGISSKSLLHREISYSKLIKQVQSDQLDREPIANAIESYLCEILFDILQEGTLRQQYGESPLCFTDEEKPFLGSCFLLVRSHESWKKAQKEWQTWQDADLLNCLPNLKPVVSKTQELKDYIPEEVYECLIKLIKGNQCLRDLAVDHDYDLLSFTKRIHPFIQKGMIGLVPIDGLEEETVPGQATKNYELEDPNTLQLTQLKDTHSKKLETDKKDVSKSVASKPKKTAKTPVADVSKPKKTAKTPVADVSKPLIIYIEDSQMDSRTMSKIVQSSNCRYFNIQEPIHAIPLLIEKKPQLIFLDLVMPIANGYEICAQIRRVSSLKKVPIIIVTSNSGIIERIRTRVKGASGFMGKPIRAEKVLKVFRKHIEPVTS